MTSLSQRFAGRIAVAVLLVLLAAGTVVASAATRPAASPPAVAEPTAAASPKAEKSPRPETSPEAREADEADEDADASPSPANLERIVDRLADAGIVTTTDDLAALAAKVGVGGAIRVLRFAQASGKTPAEILAMFEAGMGWGVIAKELKLDINVGNGSVMGQGTGVDKAAKAEAKAARAEAKAARAAERAQRKAGSGD
jgi:hypothetical protein